MRVSFLVAVVVLVLPACTLAARQAGHELAADWAAPHRHVIERTVYRPATYIDPPEILVYLRAESDVEQAGRLHCEVMAPAATSLDSDLGVTLWTSDGDPIRTDC